MAQPKKFDPKTMWMSSNGVPQMKPLRHGTVKVADHEYGNQYRDGRCCSCGARGSDRPTKNCRG